MLQATPTHITATYPIHRLTRRRQGQRRRARASNVSHHVNGGGCRTSMAYAALGLLPGALTGFDYGITHSRSNSR